MEETEKLKLIIKMEKNTKLVRNSYETLQKRYGDQYIAIDGGKVISHNPNLSELRSTLERKKVELITVLVQFIPKKGVEILY